MDRILFGEECGLREPYFCCKTRTVPLIDENHINYKQCEKCSELLVQYKFLSYHSRPLSRHILIAFISRITTEGVDFLKSFQTGTNPASVLSSKAACERSMRKAILSNLQQSFLQANNPTVWIVAWEELVAKEDTFVMRNQWPSHGLPIENDRRRKQQ